MSRRTLAVLSLSLILAAGSAAQNFAPSVSYGFASSSLDVAVGDFNGDGSPDIASPGWIQGDVAIALNDGSGNFTPHVTMPVGGLPASVEVGDLNGDQAPDLIVSSVVLSSVLVFLNNNDGSGTFQAGVPYGTGAGPTDIGLVDIDADNDLDIVTTNTIGNGLTVLFNIGNGTFVGASLGIGFTPSGIAFADLDNDTDTDMVVTLNNFNAVVILENNGVSFVPGGTFPVGLGPVDVLIADVDFDAKLDIITSNSFSNDVTVLNGLGNLSFSLPSSYPVGLSPRGLALVNADNGFGMDIAVANFGGTTINLLMNDGSGVFSVDSENVNAQPAAITTADIDGDGGDDLVVACYFIGNVSVLRNQFPAVPYPGTGEDLVLSTGVNGTPTSAPGTHVKEARNGDVVQIHFHSPLATFNNTQGFLAAQIFLVGFPPISPIPNLWMNQFGFGAVVVLVIPSMVPGGHGTSFTVTPGLEGLGVLFQALAGSPLANNGIGAFTDAHEIRFEP